VGVEKLAFSRKQQNSGIQNALKTEGIAYDASSRKFHFREFSERVLQTATRFVTNNPPIWEISDSTSMTMSPARNSTNSAVLAIAASVSSP
jgi:hypothetical protein